MIHINHSNLVLLVLRELVKKGARTSLFPIVGEFSEEEINLIDKLTLSNEDNFDEIFKLKALIIFGNLIM